MGSYMKSIKTVLGHSDVNIIIIGTATTYYGYYRRQPQEPIMYSGGNAGTY